MNKRTKRIIQAVIFLCAVVMVSVMVLEHYPTDWYHALKSYTQAFDRAVIAYVRSHTTAPLTDIMMGITLLADVRFYVVFGGAFVVWSLRKKRMAEGLMLVVSSGFGGALVLTIKEVIMRIRPDQLPIILETGYSFPSGHSMTALCFYGYLTYLFGHKAHGTVKKLAILLFGIGIVFAVGISRIYLGVHYPTDVLGAYVGGTMWLGVCILIMEKLKKKKRR